MNSKHTKKKTSSKKSEKLSKKSTNKLIVETIKTEEIYDLFSKNAIQHETPIGIFTMGIPGSGKSTVVKRFIKEELSQLIPNPTNNSKMYNYNDFILCNPDEIMPLLKDYRPENPGKHLGFASRKVSSLLNMIVNNDFKYSFIYDGTGSNVTAYVSALNRAIQNGYTIILLNIAVPVEVAIERASKRTRKVNSTDIQRVNTKLKTAFLPSHKKYPNMTPFDIYKSILTEKDFIIEINNT